MPFKCCMPACKSNYDKEKLSVFSFPKDPQLLSKWVKAVCRQDFVVTKHSKVCELHFRKCDIERSVAMFDSKAGKTITAPLSYPRLSTGAIPCILPGCPKYLSATSSSATSTREYPAAKRVRLEHENVEQSIADSVRTQEEYQNTGII